MNNLQTFKFENNNVRSLIIDDEPYFVGKDVATILGYAKARNAIASHVDEEDKKVAPIQGSLGGKQDMTIINESGLYSLILSSKLPSAKKFKRWVTNEVLPSIRKTGGYHVPQNYAQALEALLLEVKAKEKLQLQIEEDKPKVIFADAVSHSKSTILVRDLAKLLKQNGIEIGQNRLYSWMRENGYLIKSGKSKNSPTQRAMDLGLFKVREGSYINGVGANVITTTTLVTGKGQQYFINKFLGEEK